MTATFTPDELKTIANAPLMTGLAVSMVDLGIVSTIPEAAALSKTMAGAAAKYPNNSVIQAVFSEEAAKSGTIKVEKPQIKAEEVESGKLIEDAIAAINSAVAVITGKASAEEVVEYKGFVYDCAQAVADAAGSGLFGSGAKVSDKEAVALAKFKSVLVG
ncbi:hypothetical protein [Leptolyngbya ohadii]|uniref:hypothetical protein n=1 Tax=Leptolyngbya ohadii TaxID=1962290 RepID=UPI000B59A187|nr:hypothetical protein [Leptolyngbya ohadii]